MRQAAEKLLILIGKLCKYLLILFACYLLICFVVSLGEMPEVTEPGGVEWVREESRLLDYEVEGDRITVRYTVRLVNHDPDVDWEIKYPTMKFTPKAVMGWLKYEDYYMCTLEDGGETLILERGERKDIILVFEGEYFHGEVPEDLPVPRDLLYMMSVCEEPSEPV